MTLLRNHGFTAATAVLMAMLIVAGHPAFGCDAFHFLTSSLSRLASRLATTLLRLDASGLDELLIPAMFLLLGYFADVQRARWREQHEWAMTSERLATLAKLAGSVAHHIRTPLGVLQNSIHFLERSRAPSPESLSEVLTEMNRAVRNSDRIITEMLEYVLPCTPKPVLFEVDEAIRGALEAIPLPGTVRFHAPGPEIDGIRVYADKKHVVLILSKLIRNAVQAMPEGGELTVRVNPEGGGQVSVVVVDTGCGIPRADLTRIFDPLFSTKLIGLGLGLAIAQKYASLNDCSLSVETRAGRGTEFRLLFTPASLRFSPG